ncbi:IS701 family transposase [Streptomyces yunnanensis]|uniref:SRSO17 transposase n=1 Tax=Streptomyces yunnanensis TaxID=156453 RepID=A0A9X8N9T1_9ACTN|nr:transposase [Streptomyces yunnanensis]SHN35505.1 SRSO17 transposase [Streptomyces yunnanensis]
MAEELDGVEVVLVVDETGDAKSSTDCVGAGQQYSGALGGVGLCQVAVYLAAVTATTRVPLDRALYLPADWAADEERRMLAGVPDEVVFATKPQQAAAMVTAALTAGIQACWFAADEVYGGRELRWNIRALNLGYTVGVAATHPVTDGAGHRWEARKLLNRYGPSSGCAAGPDTAPRAPASTTGPGSTSAPTTPPTTRNRAGRACWSPAATATPARSPTSAASPPDNVTLATLIEIICYRWKIEETSQLAKGHTGLDQGQVTCWNSWMRWSLFSLIATIVLTLTLARADEWTGPTRPLLLIPLTCPELVRLLRVLVLPTPVRERTHALHWIAWRRHHQAVATTCHQQRHRLQDTP